jgi:hypothetical protein
LGNAFSASQLREILLSGHVREYRMRLVLLSLLGSPILATATVDFSHEIVPILRSIMRGIRRRAGSASMIVS